MTAIGKHQGLGRTPAEEHTLSVHLDAPLPAAIRVGSGTALFVAGWCFSPGRRVASLSFVVDGETQPVVAFGMPRLDVFRALHPRLDPYATEGIDHDPDSVDDPFLHSYRSGFWGTVRVAPSARDACDIAVRAELEGGGVVVAEVARIPIVAADAEPAGLAAPAPADGPLVAVCMATYNPPRELLCAQIESLRAQTHRNWVCVISDDCSDPDAFAAIEHAVDGDERFIVSRSRARLGFYGNFERALSMAPEAADFVAMADQDDRWHPDKLATLLGAIGGAELVYSDARIVGRDGTLVADTYWADRRNNHVDLTSLLVANAVTGAASLFRREVLEDALPFPPGQFAHFHDHWIGTVALARGDIAYVDRPLYDYVQHGGAALGHAAANRIVRLRDRAATLHRAPRERVRMWRLHYFVDIGRITQMATVLDLRVGDRMARPKRRALRRFLRTDRSLRALAVLWARGARELTGRPETLGAEWMLAYAFTWRRLLAATTRERPTRGLRLDAVPPPNLSPSPGRRAPDSPATAIADKIEPLTLAVRDDAPERINLLIPSIDLAHLFGGYIAKFNLARRLAERGLRVRIVTVDPQPPLPGSWPTALESYDGLDGVLDRVEVAFGREAAALEVSPSDRFVATTWWSAHIAARAARDLAAGGTPERFLYLIQEYEPFTFPMGTYASLADESYRFPHVALFSTELLRDFFRGRGIGVYADGPRVGDRASASFENAITAVEPPTAAELAARTSRRLLFYARPEEHAARNMFELGVIALRRALQQGAFGGWELHGVGTVGTDRRLELGDGHALELLRRMDQPEYATALRGYDVGLALMYTPHPSLVPIEMASAGLLTVTNSFENKTAEQMSAISSNLVTADPSVDGIATALVEAWAATGDAERRARGSRVDWSRDWDRSFADDLLDEVTGMLGLRGSAHRP